MFLNLEEARNKKKNFDWSKYNPIPPANMGIQVFENYSVEEIKDYIDWTPYFTGWGLKGKFPDIFKKENVGDEAERVYDEANHMLEEIIDRNLIKPRAIIGLFPANSNNNDDIIVYDDKEQNLIKKTIMMLRQQRRYKGWNNYLSISDYIAPLSSGKKDYIGFFAVTSGEEAEKKADEIKQSGDPYNSLIFRFIADRITEALAERLHERVRKEFWGYAPEEDYTNKQLIEEMYTGIRPAPGYPACPDHTLKEDIFSILEVEKHIGITLTDQWVMKPVSSVTGFYLAHPDSKYFRLGKITKEQLQDYAQRKRVPLPSAEEWLRANIEHDIKDYN